MRSTHRTYVSSVERGIRKPTVVVLERIARALVNPRPRLLPHMALVLMADLADIDRIRQRL